MSLCYECLFIYANCKIKHYVTPINAHESKLDGKIRELRKFVDTFAYYLDWNPDQVRPVTCTFVFLSLPFVMQMIDKVLLIFAEDVGLYMYPLFPQVREKPRAPRAPSQQVPLHISVMNEITLQI